MSNYCPNCGYMYCECRTFNNFIRDQYFNKIWDKTCERINKEKEEQNLKNYKQYFIKGLERLFNDKL